MKRPRTRNALAALLLCVPPCHAGAQDSARAEASRWIFPGSESENYLRYLQTMGLVRAYPWSARAFSTEELRELTPLSSEHPWANARALTARPTRYRGIQFDVAPAEVQTWYNTAFPYGMNDGAVWVGRGLTAAMSAGASAKWGPVQLTLAPMAFWAENRGFPLMPTRDSLRPFANPVFQDAVDLPQRFGNKPYARGDLGESSLRLDLFGSAFGISNAHEAWGPMSEVPLLLGVNAPGFPHVFFGSAKPVNAYVGRIHGRVIYASLEQSQFSPATEVNPRRFASGIVATFEPNGFRGLEIGASRFYHVVWPDSGLRSVYFTHLFESFLKQRVGKVFAPNPSDPNSSTDNQLASVFARWTHAHSGFELYGEYGREDHSADSRDLLVEPDHAAAFGVGIRKAWRKGSSLVAVRVEVLDFQTPSLLRHRSEGGFYIHMLTKQGHTNRGQLLGANAAVASGAASNVIFERFDSSGSMRAGWFRLLQDDGNAGDREPSVQHVVTISRQWFARDGRFKLDAGLDINHNLNRHFAGDRTNLRSRLASSWYP